MAEKTTDIVIRTANVYITPDVGVSTYVTAVTMSNTSFSPDFSGGDDGFSSQANLFRTENAPDYDDSFGFFPSEMIPEDFRPLPIAVLPSGISWQQRQKMIKNLKEEQMILSDADVLLSRSDLKSIAYLTAATTRYRKDVLNHRTLFVECDGYSIVEKGEIVRGIQERIFNEGGRFVIIEGMDKTGSETIIFASRQQSYEIIVNNLTSTSHPFPSMNVSLGDDDHVNLRKTRNPRRRRTVKKEETKRKKAKKETKTSGSPPKKARNSTTVASTATETSNATTNASPFVGTNQSQTLSTGLSLTSTTSPSEADTSNPFENFKSMFESLPDV